MPKHKKSVQTYLFSTIGIVAIAALCIAINAIVGAVNLRGDFTENNIYTLSSGTKEILSQIEDPVRIEFYCSENADGMPARLKNYAREVENLLHEYEEAAGGAIEVKKYTPKPLSDAADAAQNLGITPRTVSQGKEIFFGLAVTQFDNHEAISFLSPDRRNRLEYEVTRRIDTIINPEKDVLGVITSLPIMGKKKSPMAQMRQQSSQGPWWIVEQLREQYKLKKLEPKKLDKIPDSIQLLWVVHPSPDMPEKAKFAIDQFVLDGGSLMAFVDPMCASASQGQNPMMQKRQQGPPKSSNLQPLLDKWGVKYDSGKVVADLIYQTRVGGGRGQSRREMPTVLSLTNQAMNPDNPATSPLDSVILPFPGALQGSAPEGVTREVLMHTSRQSQLANKFEARMGGDNIKKDFSPSEKEFPLAISLQGTFNTAYPDGPPPSDADSGKNKDKGNGSKDKNKNSEQNAKSYLKKSSEPGTVVVVADADILNDQFSVRKQQLFGREITRTISDNGSFVQNKVEQLTGSTSLAQIRSRGAEKRPFVVINEMRAEARADYKDQINALEEELSEIRSKLQNLQKGSSGDKSFEENETLQRFREKKLETRRELKELRKDLREEVDTLKGSIKWANMGAIPFLVMLAGIAIALIRRRRETQK